MSIVTIRKAYLSYNLSKFYPYIIEEDLEFKPGFVVTEWITKHIIESSYKFEVLLCFKFMNQIGTHNRKLCCFMKPIKPYNVFEFEELFDLKENCKKFDINKIVALEYYDNESLDKIIINKK